MKFIEFARLEQFIRDIEHKVAKQGYVSISINALEEIVKIGRDYIRFFCKTCSHSAMTHDIIGTCYAGDCACEQFLSVEPEFLLKGDNERSICLQGFTEGIDTKRIFCDETRGQIHSGDTGHFCVEGRDNDLDRSETIQVCGTSVNVEFTGKTAHVRANADDEET
jgi:hypothetical protein